MTGGAVPVCQGIVLSLQQMNAIEEIDTQNFVATVQPGVFTADLHAAVEAQGLFYPPDPGSMKYSSIGGNIAENAGGMRAVKYGVTSAFVMGLEVVLPSGEIIHAGSKCIKDVTGLNIAPLFIGSEGTLGIITKAHLRLVPLQKCRMTCCTAFPSIDDSILAVTDLLRSGITPLTLEFMDSICILALEKSMGFNAPAGTGGILVVETEGTEAQADEDMQGIVSVFRQNHALDIHVGKDKEERERIWKARRSVSPALLHIKPKRMNEDIVVPRSRIGEMCRRIQQISRRHDLVIACFGHAGDGNLHVHVMHEDTEEQDARAFAAVSDIFTAAAALEGRISGEHGIGIAKKSFLSLNVDTATLALMKKFKRVFDPKGILNPGKIFPD